MAFEVQRRRSAGKRTAELAAHARSCLILSFLLGLTWSVGFLIAGPLAVYAAYLFVLLNGSLGAFLFVHTVVLNENVAGELRMRLLRRWWTRSEFKATKSGGLSSSSAKEEEEARRRRRRKERELASKTLSSYTASSTSL